MQTLQQIVLIIKNTNGIFNDFVVYEKYLEAFHFWKNDFVVGDSKIGLLYCPTYPADRLPNPFNIVQPSDPWTKRKDPKYPFGQFLNKEMLLTKSQEELDKLLVENNKNRKNKTKAIKLVEKPIKKIIIYFIIILYKKILCCPYI